MQGTVVVKGGKLLHASWGPLVGQDALREIIAAEDGVFRTAPLPVKIETTISNDWQYALMEAVRSLDERAQGKHRRSGSFPAIRIDDSVFDNMQRAQPSQDSKHAHVQSGRSDARSMPRSPGASSALVDKGFAALRAGKVDEARECWLAAKQLDPENRSLDLNLRRLEKKTSH
jgi:hypothetical protein